MIILPKKKEMLQIKIKYLTDITPLEFIGGQYQSNWIDLRTAEDVYTYANKLILIPLGVSMQLPKGYEAHIVPRSSTFKTWGIIQANHMGVIDESYNGDGDEWMFPAIGFWETKIPKNSRICQFRIMKKMEPVKFEVVDKLNNKNRGGFGSSGVQ